MDNVQVQLHFDAQNEGFPPVLRVSTWSSISHYICWHAARDVYMHVLYNHVAHFLWLMYSPTHHLTHSHWSRSYRRHPSVSPQCWSPTGELALPVFETSGVSACSEFLVTCGTAPWSSGPPPSPSPGDHSIVPKGFLPSWVPPSVWHNHEQVCSLLLSTQSGTSATLPQVLPTTAVLWSQTVLQ